MRFSMLAHFRFVIFLAAMYLCGIVAAQGVDRGSDYYRSQYVRLHKAYLKDTNDVENLVNLSRFYSDERNPMFSLPFARGYLNRADSRYRFMLSGNEHDRELRRLINRGITLRSLDEAKKHLSRQAVLKLSSEELSLVEVDQFLDAFSDDKAVLKQAGIQRVKSAYRSVLRQNTIAAYVAFVKQYPGTEESRSAERHIAMMVDSLYDGSSDVSQADAYLKAYDDNPEVRRSVMRHHAEFAFKSACRDNTIESYRSFVDNYPSSNHSIIALHRIDSLSELSLGSIQSPKGYVDFALANPGSELADRAIDELFRKVMDENNVQAARLFMKHFDDDPRYVDVYKRYYEWYSQEACYPLIDTFAHAHPDYPFRSSLNGDLNEAADIESLNLERPFDEARIWNYKELVKSFPSKRIAYVALQRMLQNLIATSNWPDALERCRTFEGRFQGYNKIAYDTLLSLLSSPFDAARLPVDYLVSSDVDITSSAVAPSGKALYFTSRTSSSSLYSAILKGGKWTHVAPFSIEGAPEGALSVFSLFDNGNKVLLGSAGDILVAAYDGSRWRVSEVLPYPVNTDFVETDAFMLPDGSGFLFASDRPLGYNVQPSGMHYHGDTALASDLYFVPFTTAGWGEPINLGFRVNSCYCERYPVLSRDLKTLYFVSDCGGGLGYGDIYVSHRSSIDDWQGWSHPRNLGKEVNSAFAESSLSLSPNGGKLCFTSSRPGAQGHLFVATVEAQASSAYSTLRISDDSDGLVNCRVFDLATNAEVRVDYDGTSRSVILCNGHTYAVSFVQKDRWRPMFTVRGGDKTELRASGNTPSELEGRTCPLSFIVLDRHDSKLTSLARVEIEQLAHFLQKNPSLLIDIVVDCPGKNTAQCHEQSVAIGESVRAAVVDSGVSIDRISVVGRGNLESHASGHNAVFVRFRTR
ncbi:MAG: hypothetical protein K5867_11050 [Bacteroidales bacterium]|nr:hypothetical protein [Bacteroidales bacterium]